MARRGLNIYPRKDKRWEGRYITGHKPDGKPIFGYVYGSSYNDCKNKLLPLKAAYCKIGSEARSDLHHSGLADGTIRNIFRYLCNVTKAAVKSGAMAQDICADIVLSKPKKTDIDALSCADQQSLERVAYYAFRRAGQGHAHAYHRLPAPGQSLHTVGMAKNNQYQVGHICAAPVDGDLRLQKRERH